MRKITNLLNIILFIFIAPILPVNLSSSTFPTDANWVEINKTYKGVPNDNLRAMILDEEWIETIHGRYDSESEKWILEVSGWKGNCIIVIVRDNDVIETFSF